MYELGQKVSTHEFINAIEVHCVRIEQGLRNHYEEVVLRVALPEVSLPRDLKQTYT